MLEYNADLDITAKYGLSALMLAVVNHHSDVAKELIDAGAFDMVQKALVGHEDAFFACLAAARSATTRLSLGLGFKYATGPIISAATKISISQVKNSSLVQATKSLYGPAKWGRRARCLFILMTAVTIRRLCWPWI